MLYNGVRPSDAFMAPKQKSKMSLNERYIMSTAKLLPDVTEDNPYLKEMVGQCIFEYV